MRKESFEWVEFSPIFSTMETIANLSMRSRLLALIILLLFLGVPGLLYWYFFSVKESHVHFTSTSTGMEFDISVDGKLEYEYFPIADSILHFTEHCRGSCILTVPPVKYALILTSLGMQDIHDSITLSPSEEKSYTFIPRMKLRVHFLKDDPDSIPWKNNTLIRYANESLGWQYVSVWISRTGKQYAIKRMDGSDILGIVTLDGFITLASFPYTVDNIIPDLSRQYFVIDRGIWSRILLSLDGQRSIIFPYDIFPQVIEYSSWVWKVKTEKDLYLYENSEWKKNTRFTDCIDLNWNIRIGYIDQSDTVKLSLQNLPLGHSVLSLIDRTTGESRMLASDLALKWLFILDDQPAFIDQSWKVGIFEF